MFVGEIRKGAIMNCTIYVTEFKINAKYYNTIIDYSSWEFYDPWSENYQRVSKEWKEKRVKPLLQPYNFHFEPWKEMITGFDPENYADWELFRKAARNQHHFFWNIENAEFWNEERYDWMPESMMETMMAYYIVYKMVDENGHLVNTKPYLQKYLDTYHQKKEAHKRKYGHSNYIYMQRFLHTTNEKRQLPTKEELREWKEEGYHIKIRGGRKNLLNEDPWGDHFKDVKIPRSWKDQTKQKRQYHSYKKQKRKKYGKE